MELESERGTEKSLFEVEIAGLPLKLKSSHDEQTVRQLIEMVNSRVNEALALSPSISFQKALLLASLHIAEDLVFTRRMALAELDQLESKAKNILSGLESSPLSRMGIES